MSERGEVVAWALEWVYDGETRGMRLYDDETHCVFDAESDGGIASALVRQSDYLALREELVELRQAVWDARATMGFDNDGDSTPDALKFPTLAVMVIADAKEMRDDYDAAIAELDALKARIAESRVVEADDNFCYARIEEMLPAEFMGKTFRLLLEES